GREETNDGLRLSFRSHPEIRKELEALVAVESECCSWAAWSGDDEGGTLVMAARPKGLGGAPLHGVFPALAGPRSGDWPACRRGLGTGSRDGTGFSSASSPQPVPLRARTASSSEAFPSAWPKPCGPSLRFGGSGVECRQEQPEHLCRLAAHAGSRRR